MVELSDVHKTAIIFENGRLVVIRIQVIRCREDRHDRRKTGC